ncbi:MAG: V-type ATP synthase subunit K [Coriobacteriia bacterium]|nr:V-type ATP synthase subunit K [Coriobacteriia bacterium]
MNETIMGATGLDWAYLGAAVAAIGGGIGSSIGITSIANTAAGIVSEDPEKFGKLLPLAAMPGTQGIYGLVTMILVFVFTGVFAGTVDLTPSEGLRVFYSCLPVAFVCAVSGIYQGLTAVGAAGMVARRDEDAGKALIFPALVETYAVFSLVVTILMLLYVTG